MIVVRVELHSAITGQVQELARMDIVNDGTGSKQRGNYRIRSMRGRSAAALDASRVQRECEIRDWPRLSKHVLHLVAAGLVKLGYGT
jgi:hypothetical protein